MTAIRITFLGTSSMVPTKDRGQSGIYLDCGKEKILVDCGENIQRQMRIAEISPPRTTRIFLSHWHGDHVFGLPGMLENIAKNSFEKKVCVYGTKEVKNKLFMLMKTFDIDKKIQLDFTIINKDGVFLEDEDYIFGAYFLRHSIPCLGYYVQYKDRVAMDKDKMKKLGLPSGEVIAQLKSKKNIIFKGKTIKWKDVTYLKEGKKVGIVLDTGVCKGAVQLAKDADIAVIESTFLHERADKAKLFKHLTAVQAGEIAKKAKAKKLVITHFSQRYEEADVNNKMLQEAKKAFGKEVVCAKDFMTISI